MEPEFSSAKRGASGESTNGLEVGNQLKPPCPTQTRCVCAYTGAAFRGGGSKRGLVPLKQHSTKPFTLHSAIQHLRASIILVDDF